MSNALTLYEGDRFKIMQRTATALAASGMFSEKDQAKAIAKVMAGAELGIPPFQSMSGVNIIKGKATLSAAMISTLVKRSGRYNYRVPEHTDKTCTIEFYENGEKCGTSTFTIQDAQKAGLLSNNQVWGKYPRNMLFARAMSNGARWYCADVFGGAPVYTPEEMGQAVNEDGDMIEGEIVETSRADAIIEEVVSEIEPTPQPTAGNAQNETAKTYALAQYLEGYKQGRKYNVRTFLNVSEISKHYQKSPHLMNTLNMRDDIKAYNVKATANNEPQFGLDTEIGNAEKFAQLANYLINRKEQG